MTPEAGAHPRAGRRATRRSSPALLAPAARLSLNALLIAAALAGIAWLVVQLRVVVVPVIVALLATALLAPPAHALKARGWPGALAAAAVMTTATGLLAGTLALLAPAVAAELDTLGTSARQGLDELLRWLAEGPLGIAPAEIERALDRALAAASANSALLGQGLLGGAIVALEVVAGLLVAVVLTFFFLADGDRLWRWLIAELPPAARADTAELGRRCWTILGAYIRGIAVVALVDAVLIGIALALIGVPLVLPLATLTFLAAFLPLVGAVLAGAIAALVALVTVGPLAALLVIAAIVAIQQLEGDLLYPVLVGRAIDLHPVATLLALTAGGVTAGIIGAALAVPAAAIAWAVTDHFKTQRPDSAPAHNGPPPPATTTHSSKPAPQPDLRAGDRL